MRNLYFALMVTVLTVCLVGAFMWNWNYKTKYDKAVTELVKYKLETGNIASQLMACKEEVEENKDILNLIKRRFMEGIKDCEYDCEE